MRVIGEVLGSRHDPAFADALHRLAHLDRIDKLVIDSAESARRRFRSMTTLGLEVAIALPRDQRLADGAVLALEADYALLLQVTTPQWLRLTARDAAAALELGYQAGNLHWRVKFDDTVLLVALEQPSEVYRDRLQHMIDAGLVSIAC